MKPKEADVHKNTPPVKRSTAGKLIRLFLFVIIILFLLLLLLSLLIQLPYFQNLIVDKFNKNFSEKTETELRIESVHLSLSKGLVLHNLYLADYNGDTLVYAEDFSTSLNKNLYFALYNEFDIDDINLSKAVINIRTPKGESQSNIQKVFSQLGRSGESSGEPAKTPKLYVGTINIDDVRASIINENTDAEYRFALDRGHIEISDEIYLDSQSIGIKRLELTNPNIFVQKGNQNPNGKYTNGAVNNSTEPIKATVVTVDHASILSGDLVIASQERTRDHKGFDSNNFSLEDLNLELTEFSFHSADTTSLARLNITGRLDDQVNIQELTTENFSFSDRHLKSSVFVLKTDQSTIRQNVDLKKSADEGWEQLFGNSRATSDIQEIDIALEELVYLVPSLNNIEIIQSGVLKTLKLDGQLQVNGDNVAGQNLRLVADEGTVFEGNLDLKDLNSDNGQLNVRIKKLQSNVVSLRKYIKSFQLPENFNKLGNITFVGQIDGYVHDFVTYGDFSTDLGNASLDLRLDTKSGFNDAAYSGLLALENFDLGKWSDNDDFGIVSIDAEVIEGRGLTGDNASARFNATLESFTYKDYPYTNVIANGALDGKKFSGDLEMEDPNASFNFNGVVEIGDTSIYNFGANVERIDLYALNLMKEPFAFSGNVDTINILMQGSDLKGLVGNASAYDLRIESKDTTFVIDSLYVLSEKIEDDMLFEVKSEVAYVEVLGDYDLRSIHSTFAALLKDNYPYHFRNLNVPESTNEANQDFDFTFQIRDSKNLFTLAGVPNLRLIDTNLNGDINNKEESFTLKLDAPRLSYDKYKLIKVEALASSAMNKGEVQINVDTTVLSSTIFNPIKILTQFEEDKIDFDISTSEILDSLQNISITGELLPHSNGYEVQIDSNNWIMLGEEWNFEAGNRIAFGSDFIEATNVEITDGDRSILIDDIDTKGLRLRLNGFDIDLLNPIIDYDKMTFTGRSYMDISIDQIFDSPKIRGDIFAPDFRINNDPFGELKLVVEENISKILDVDFLVADDSQTFNVNGSYDLDASTVNSTITVNDFPFKLFEYIVPEGISNTGGRFNVDAFIDGHIDDLKLQGQALTDSGQVKIDYIGVTFFFDQQPVTLTEKFIDFSEAELKDRWGNEAFMTGGLRHDFFTGVEMDMSMESDRFTILNTTKADNPLYYGLGQGKVKVDFSGPFDAADFRVNAVSGPGTHIYFPIATTQSDFDESFIKFNKKESAIDSLTSFEDELKLLGLDFEMNLELTDDALVEMIFDERVGEIMKGKGRGNMSIFIKRTGVFDVFGDYEIEEGEYLFTAYGLVAKPFEILRGGRLVWDGDPFDAQLNVEAEYKGLKAPLDVFLSEYLASAPSERLVQEAKNRTDVNLKMILGGTLFRPDVDFDVEFPEVNGELRSYTESKMRTLRATDNGINNQVVGLLVFRNFLPYDNPLATISGGSLLSTGSSTLTEFITSQISILLTDVIQRQLDDDSFIQGIDVNIGLGENSNIFSDGIQDANLTPDEVDVNTRYRFKNENWVLNTGVNYVWESSLGVGNYLVGDVVLDWYITDDRRLKFKFYSKYDFDEAFNSRKIKNGFGINYRKEFGDFSEFLEEIETKAKEKPIQQEVSPGR